MLVSPPRLASVGNGIPQLPDARDRYFDSIAGHNRPDALGRASRDQVSGFERHDLRDVTDDNIKRENKIPRVAGLPHFAIDAGFDLNASPRIDVNVVGDHRTNWAECVETFGTRPLTVFLLQIAGGEVIHAGVAENVGTNVVAVGELAAAAPDHDSEFTFVVGALGISWPENRS